MRALALTALCACWTTPHAPSATTGIPGLVWITPPQPWHMTHAPTAIVTDGDTAIVGGAAGWIARVDLRTGELVQERRLGEGFTLYDLARLRDGRWIAVGIDRGTTRAVVVDGATLAATPITLGVVPDRSYAHAGVAVTADGGVVIAGKGLPLAIYDPRTWKIRNVLGSELGWNRPRVLGSTLGVTLGSTAFSFDLVTAARTELGPAATVQATATLVALKVYDKGKWYAELWEHGEKRVRLPDPIDALALAPDGKRLVTTSQGQLNVYAAPFDQAAARIDLGAAARGVVVGLVLDGDRALVSSASILRVVDLRTGRVSAAGAAPWGAPVQLAVGADGTVLDLGAYFAWRIVNGKVVTTAELGEGHVLVSRRDEVARYAVRTDRTIAVRAIAGAEVASWAVPQEPLEGWLGANGTVVVDTLFERDQPSRLFRSEGKGLVSAISYTAEADVRDVDPDGGDALIVTGGRVYVVHVRDGSIAPKTLRTPGCADYASAELERGGKRATTYNGRDLAVWDRTTGVLLGTARFTEDISRTIFVPGRDEIIVGVTSGLILLRPGREARVLTLPDYAVAEVSPDGRRLAIGFGNGRVALVDLDALRAALVPTTISTNVTLPKECKADDPFKVEEAVEPEIFEGGD